MTTLIMNLKLVKANSNFKQLLNLVRKWFSLSMDKENNQTQSKMRTEIL
jgi:hypothetical protein